MLLLALDTATAATTVAVHDGVRVLAERTEVDARRHGDRLAPLLDEVLRAAGVAVADVTLVACGVGPGPYTGLRVGVVTARTLGFVLGVPVVGVCTLDVLAYAARSGRPLGVATDARRREVYWAAYDGDGHRTLGPLVNRPADVLARVPDLPFVGDGAAALQATRGAALEAVGAAPAVASAGAPTVPSAGALAAYVLERLAAGEALPAGGGEPAATLADDAEAEALADDRHGDGEPTATALRGAVLLPPVPLYLRRPDAVAPGAPKPVTPA